MSKPKLSRNEGASLLGSTQFPFIIVNYDPSAGGANKNKKTIVISVAIPDWSFEFRWLWNLSFDQRPEPESFQITKPEKF